MILLKFLCCLDAEHKPTKKYRVKSQAEAGSWEAAEEIVKVVFEKQSREGWKVEYELTEPIGATYSTPANSYPMTVHKISKDGTKVWASYDTYTADAEAEGGYRYTNNNATNQTQWIEYQLKIINQNRTKWVRKGEPASSWPIHIGYRKFSWLEEF